MISYINPNFISFGRIIMYYIAIGYKINHLKAYNIQII